MLRSRIFALISLLFIATSASADFSYDLQGGKNYCDAMFNIRMQQRFQEGGVVMSNTKQRYLRLCYKQWGLAPASFQMSSVSSLTGNPNIDQFKGICGIEAEMAVLSRQERGLPITTNFVERYTNRCFDRAKRTFGAEADVSGAQDSGTIEI